MQKNPFSAKKIEKTLPKIVFNYNLLYTCLEEDCFQKSSTNNAKIFLYAHIISSGSKTLIGWEFVHPVHWTCKQSTAFTQRERFCYSDKTIIAIKANIII